MAELGKAAPDVPAQRPLRDFNDFTDTFALFTGGMALSENLQLDRMLLLPPANLNAGGATVEIGKLEGITVEEMDWSSRVEGLNPRLDTLAKFIPADQHAI